MRLVKCLSASTANVSANLELITTLNTCSSYEQALSNIQMG